ncbi:MAG: hypothetical protein ACE5O2_12305 [Armatimonadota bacterium]
MGAYTGILRQFNDGTWGALCFELGLITRGASERDALKQMEELIEFELECIRNGDPRTEATVQLLEDFMTADVAEPEHDEFGISDPFPIRRFRIGDAHNLKLAIA